MNFFIFLAASPLVHARFGHVFAASPLSRAADKTVMLRRLLHREKVATVRRVQSNLYQWPLLYNGHFFGGQSIH